MYISIVIPLFNKENCIEETVESVLCQTYTDFELLIVNDGSTDNSVDIVKEIKDTRIKIIHKKNGGVSSARNLGAKKARGNWLFFLDADDYIFPTALEHLTKLSYQYPLADVLSANFETRYSKIKSRKGTELTEVFQMEDAFKYIVLNKWNMRLGSFLVKKSLHFKVLGFPLFISKGEDVYYIYNILKVAKVAFTPELVMRYELFNSYYSFQKTKNKSNFEWYIILEKDLYFKNIICSFLILKELVKRFVKFRYISFFNLLFRYLSVIHKVLINSFLLFMHRLYIKL